MLQPLPEDPPPPLRGRVLSPNGTALYQASCITVSIGGMYVCTAQDPPAIFERLRILLELQGTLLECPCEVVRHVSRSQAVAWGIPLGFGVQFSDHSAAFRAAIRQALERPRAPRDDPEAERVLRNYRRGIQEDPHAILGLAKNATPNQVRRAAREARQRLEGLKQRPLSPSQRHQIHLAIEQVDQALLALFNPIRRVGLAPRDSQAPLRSTGSGAW
jgi:eukaryotic-like serine/threonine-protein kinase